MHRPANFTPNGTTSFSRQKSSDVKDIKYIKRTKSKQKRHLSRELQDLHQFKKRITNNLQIDNKRLHNKNSQLKQERQQKQAQNQKKCKQEADSFSQKNESFKQNREQNFCNNNLRDNIKKKYEKQEYLSKKEQNLTKLMKFGQISNKNKATNQFIQQMPVYISSRSNNNQSACGSSIYTKSQQNSYLKKYVKGQSLNQDSTFISKIYTLILDFQQKDKFSSSKFQKNGTNNFNSQLSTEKMYEKIKVFIEQKENQLNQVCHIVNQINTLNVSSPYTFSNKNLIKILNDVKKQITQMSQIKRKCQDFNKTLLAKARQCENLKQSKTKLIQQVNKLKQDVRNLSQKNDEFLSKQMANSQKMSQLQYHLMIVKKELEQNKKFEKCNRETLDLQQQLKILGYQNNDQQRQILQLNEQNQKLKQQKMSLEISLSDSILAYQQFSKILKTKLEKCDMQTQVNQMSQSQRDNLQQKIKIQEEFQELCVEKLNLQAKIIKIQNKFKQKQKINKQKLKKTKLKMQELKQKLDDLQCQNSSIRNDISRFFQEAFQVMVENLEKAFYQNYCQVSENNGYEKIYYETTAFMDQANQCKIDQIQQKQQATINQKTKQRQNNQFYQKDLQKKDQQINELKHKIIFLQNSLQQKDHKFQNQLQKVFKLQNIKNQELTLKLKQLQLQNEDLQKKNKQVLVQNSKNLNQNQRYIQDLMIELRESQEKNLKFQKQLNLNLISKQKQIKLLKGELEGYVFENSKRQNKLMRISSFIIDYKIYNNLPLMLMSNNNKLFIQKETVSMLIQSKNQFFQKLCMKQAQNQTTQSFLTLNTEQIQVQVDLSAKQEQNFDNFQVNIQKISQSCKQFQTTQKEIKKFSIQKCQQIKIIPIQKEKTLINEKLPQQQSFEIKEIIDSNNKKDGDFSCQKPDKSDTFMTYLSKFSKIPSQNIQKYLIRAVITSKSQNQEQDLHKGQKNINQQSILATINKQLFQSGKKTIKTKFDYCSEQKQSKQLLKSVQKNMKLMRSVHNQLNTKEDNKNNSQRQKDDSEFDLCI